MKIEHRIKIQHILIVSYFTRDFYRSLHCAKAKLTGLFYEFICIS